MNYTKNDVFRFVEENDASGVTATLSSRKVADVFMKLHPDCIFSRDTVRTYVQRFRNGENYTHDHQNQINETVQNIQQNINRARDVFNRPETVQIDTNPLGVLKEQESISKTFFDIPESYANYKAPLKLDGYGKRMGVVSDTHFPIHCREAVLAGHAFLKKQNIDFLLLLGDIMDCSNITRHPMKKSISYTWREEIEVGKAYFKSLRVLFPDIPILYQFGNHELWFTQYIINQAAKLEGDYILQDRLELEKHNIQFVDDDRLMTYGKLYATHGHTLGIGGGRNVATRILDKHGVNLICGHYHRIMADDKRTLDDATHAVWINGCLSDVHPAYNPHNNSTHGVSIVDLLDEDGGFKVTQYRIINGRVVGE